MTATEKHDSSIESMEENEESDDFFDTQECYVQEQKQESKKNPEEEILDSGSTISIFKDACLVRNIRKAKHKLMLYKNSGEMIIDKEADVPGHGRGFFQRESHYKLIFVGRFNNQRQSRV